ncbi:MAG: aromatic ring-hydroxylating dioxygenase subunit alpha [Actinomycetota bacterium]
MPPTTLPGRAYTDPARLEQEIVEMLRPAWHCIGRADELPEPGDHVAFTILDEPVVLVRGADGQLRALSNICRHRGMRVVAGGGSGATSFTCPYHAWNFAIDGELRTAPFTEPAAVEGCRLPTWPLVEERGFVYVSVSPEPIPFEVPADLIESTAQYNPADFRFVTTETEVWNCNWKAMVENFMEGSHLSFVHRESLHHLTPTRLATKGPSGDGFTSFYSAFPDGVRSENPGEAGLDEIDRRRSILYQRFPTQVVSQNQSFLASFLVLPLDVDHTEIRWTLSAFRGCDDEMIQRTIDMWHTLNVEDRAILETMHRNLQAPSAQDYAGPLADDDREGTIADFHRYLRS